MCYQPRSQSNFKNLTTSNCEKMGWGYGWYVIPFLILLFYALLFVLILMITQRGSWIATDICGKFPF